MSRCTGRRKLAYPKVPEVALGNRLTLIRTAAGPMLHGPAAVLGN